MQWLWPKRRMFRFLILFLLIPVRAATFSELQAYRGMCDASAAAELDAEHFAVANDEDNRVRIYSSAQGEFPVQTLDLSPMLDLENPDRETDLEGSARIGDTIYWISSHGRNKDGKLRPNRYRFLGTRFRKKGDEWVVEAVGRPYKGLLADMIADPRLEACRLAEASALPPKEKGGLNIEGMAANGKGGLLIGFRNPTPNGKALVLPLANPEEVVDDKRARFDPPILLDLGGLGIREMTRIEGRYIVVAGPTNGKDDFRLFEWDGSGRVRWLSDISLEVAFNPECVVAYPERSGELLLLSDDGTREIDGVACKDLKDSQQRQFRGMWVRLD